MEEKITVRRRKKRRNHTRGKFCFFLVLALLLVGIAVFAPSLTPFEPNSQDLSQALLPPGGKHLLGTDRYGRDLLSRVIMGARSTIFSALALMIVVSVFGTGVGLVCGYKGGKLDSILMRISDVFLAFPGMVFAVAVAGVFGGGIGNAVVALAAISWPKYARIARSQVLTVRSMAYVEAARMGGCGSLEIMLCQILPNIVGPVLVTATLDIGVMMMELAGLSFLGLGVPASHGRVGFDDERREKYAPDGALGSSGSWVRYICVSDGIQSVGRHGAGSVRSKIQSTEKGKIK